MFANRNQNRYMMKGRKCATGNDFMVLGTEIFRMVTHVITHRVIHPVRESIETPRTSGLATEFSGEMLGASGKTA